jgi:non-homologous end joining protein Ku
VKAYPLDKETFIEVSKDELDEIALESTRTIEIDEFVKLTKDMLDLARHIVNEKAGDFEPQKLEDRYEAALIELINRKRAGQPITPSEKPSATNVVDLMEALRRSVGQQAAPAKAQKPGERRLNWRETEGSSEKR